MITAIVFVQADVSQIPEVAQQIAAIDGVSEVYSVTGSIDLICMIEDEFQIQFTTREVANLANVGELISVIERKVAQ